jgi:hypothetical protein
MSETNNGNQPHDKLTDDLLSDDIETGHSEPGLRARINKFVASAQAKKSPTKEQLKKDRTRSFMLLIGGVVGALLLFLGIFSTPPAPFDRESRDHSGPNLGRPRSSEPNNPGPSRSVTPLLNADVRSDDSKGKEVSPADIQNTSRSGAQSNDVNVPKIPNLNGDGATRSASCPQVWPRQFRIQPPIRTL